MKCSDDILKKFNEFESTATSCLPKVNFNFMMDLMRILKEDEYPMFSLQVFLKENTDTDRFREIIFKDLGILPAFHDHEEFGKHAAIEHRVKLDTLEYLSNFDEVVKINGVRSGGGRASLGLRLERDTDDQITNTVK